MNLEDFMSDTKDVTLERRNRIRLTVAAYAYEFVNHSIMSDGDFDKLALQINPEVSTIEEYHTDPIQIERYKVLDKFFREEFQPDTGQWIHKHPELNRVEYIYNKYFSKGE